MDSINKLKIINNMEIISAIIINLIDHKKIKGYENLEIFYGKYKLYTTKEKIKNLKKQFLDKFNINYGKN